MSLPDAVGRIQQIQTMMGALSAGAAPPTPAAAPPSTDFSQQLAQAQQSAAPATPTTAATTGATAGSNSPSAYDAPIQAAAAKYGLDPALLKGLIRQESGFNPNASSAAGAKGLTQLMPGTAAALGVTNPSDPTQSIDAGAHYLRQQLDAFGGDVRKALAAYNAGPGAVSRYGGVPPYAETQQYVQKVLAYAAEYRAAGGPRASSV